MDRPRHNDQLAVNKIGKKIKKTPLHLPSLANGNTSKNRLKSIVPQLTSSPMPKISPAALTQINPPPAMAQPPSQPMIGHGNQFWSNTTADSPVSMYMPSLQSSLGDSGNHMQPSHQYQPHSNGSSSPDKPSLPSQLMHIPTPRFSGDGILPSPVSTHIRSPQSSFGDSGANRVHMQPSHEYQPHSRNHHSSGFSGSASSVPILPSPKFNGRGILPTPSGLQYPPPRTPRSLPSSSMTQGGILGPGKFPHPSTGLVFPPPSPFGEKTN